MTPSLLIVDDEQDMLQLLRRSLESELDCKVQTASSGEKALQRLHPERKPCSCSTLIYLIWF
jgi:CheY-like chemotaxis protein